MRTINKIVRNGGESNAEETEEVVSFSRMSEADGWEIREELWRMLLHGSLFITSLFWEAR